MKNLIILLFISYSSLLFGQATNFEKAQKQFEQKNYTEAIQLLANEKTSAVPTLTLLGKSYYQVKKYQKAIDCFEKAVEQNGKSAELRYLLGQTNFTVLRSNMPLNKKGVYAHRVKKNFKKALELDSSHTKARFELARYYLNAPKIAGGSISKARKHAKILAKFDKKMSYQLEAAIYLKKKDYKQAEQVYLTLLKEKLSDHSIYYTLAFINYQMKQYKNSMDYCEQSIKAFPAYLISYYMFAKTAATAATNIDQGIDYAQLYLKKDPDNKAIPGNHWVYYRLGLLYQLKGNDKLATESFNKALAIKSDFKQAKKALNK